MGHRHAKRRNYSLGGSSAAPRPRGSDFGRSFGLAHSRGRGAHAHLCSIVCLPIAVLLLCAGHAGAQTLTSQAVRQIATAFTSHAVQSGSATGAAVSIVYPGMAPAAFAAGLANAATRAPFTPNTVSETASLTKLFTVALLGEAVLSGRLSLQTTLGEMRAQTGPLQPLMQQARLADLADFTAGLPLRPPLCSQQSIPGCMPSQYPDQSIYPVSALVQFVQGAVPGNYGVTPPVELTALPGPAQYSDISTGLLGLLLATPGGPVGAASPDAWAALVRRDILRPLGMNSTQAGIPGTIAASRIAAGYQPAAAVATVSGGSVTVRLTDRGAGYTAPPAVTVSGGGGHGAAAAATVAGGQAVSITMTNAGTGYAAPPVIGLTGVSAMCTVTAAAIVAAGKITGVSVLGSSGGCTSPSLAVTITGGRAPGGRDATAIAHLWNGFVTAMTVTDGGAGYFDPLTVTVAPGAPDLNPVPAWAPAGSLSSTAANLASFTAAELGLASVNGAPVPQALTQALQLTQAEYVCEGPAPGLVTCPPLRLRGGLAWIIQPADTAAGAPRMLAKSGGLTGFDSAMVLLPDQKIGVAVLANGPQTNAALTLASDIALNLYYAGQ